MCVHGTRMLVCRSVGLLACPSVCLCLVWVLYALWRGVQSERSLSWPVFLYICLYVCLSDCLSVCLSLCLSFGTSVCLSVCAWWWVLHALLRGVQSERSLRREGSSRVHSLEAALQAAHDELKAEKLLLQEVLLHPLFFLLPAPPNFHFYLCFSASISPC